MLLPDACRVHPVGGRHVWRAGWMARIGWSGLVRPLLASIAGLGGGISCQWWACSLFFIAIAVWNYCQCETSVHIMNEKAFWETQTLQAGCSKSGPKIFAPPPADPLPRGAWWPKFNQLEMVTTPTYKPSLVRIDACNFELSWLTDPQSNTHKHTQTGPITIQCTTAS